MLISLKVRARKAGTDAMLAFMSPPWQSYLLDDDTKIARSHTVSQIVPRLYISNLCSATNEEKLKEHGITHVVSVLEEKPKFPQSPQLKKLHIPVADTYYSPLLQHMDQTTEFIKNALEENETNVVLVCIFVMSHISHLFFPHCPICPVSFSSFSDFPHVLIRSFTVLPIHNSQFEIPTPTFETFFATLKR